MHVALAFRERIGRAGFIPTDVSGAPARSNECSRSAKPEYTQQYRMAITNGIMNNAEWF